MPLPQLRAVFLPALLWAWLFWHLHYTWELDEQYRYGWAVPLLAALLIQSRWRDRPKPAQGAAPPAPQAGDVAASPSTALRFGLASINKAQLVQWLLLALLLPIRLIEEANPDWRLLSWVFALVVVCYTLTCFLRWGGKPWLRHFAFPICFALVAVPWLVQFENAVVQTLMRAVAGAAVEIAGWQGLGAYQFGNVIQLRNGFVGVDEACSGVRTLQTAIMVSLFLGELLRMSAVRRVLLVVIGSAWVFVCNVARAATLVSIAGWHGFDALHRAHDAVGTAVMVAGLAGILAAAFCLRGRNLARRAQPAAPGRFAELSGREITAAIIWVGAVFGASELWYSIHERHLVVQPAWRVQWPGNSRPLPIADSTRAILRYNEATSAAWAERAGAEWWGFFADWKAHRTAAQLVRSHSPEICLPAIGRTFERELEPLRIEAPGISLSFRFYQFSQNEKPLFVFVCIQEDKTAEGATTLPEWTARGRLAAAWIGRRNPGQRLLELALIGANGTAEAARDAAQLVPTIVRSATRD